MGKAKRMTWDSSKAAQNVVGRKEKASREEKNHAMDLSAGFPPVVQPAERPEINEVIHFQGLGMVWVPAGSFQMGVEDIYNASPMHKVTLQAFWMSATQITQALYLCMMGTNPSQFTGKINRPVEMINWYDAVRFCNRLSEHAGLEPSYDLDTWDCDFTRNGYRLPAEAEWEYACRAGTTTKYYTGDTENHCAQAGWYKANSGSTTHPVSRKEPNAWGLYDMHGNIWEWCHDWHSSYSSESQTNPTGPQTDSFRVMRGGSLGCYAEGCRSAARGMYDPNGRGSSIGFRVVRL